MVTQREKGSGARRCTSANGLSSSPTLGVGSARLPAGFGSGKIRVDFRLGFERRREEAVERLSYLSVPGHTVEPR
jgi:hypothetical protein